MAVALSADLVQGGEQALPNGFNRENERRRIGRMTMNKIGMRLPQRLQPGLSPRPQRGHGRTGYLHVFRYSPPRQPGKWVVGVVSTRARRAHAQDGGDA